MKTVLIRNLYMLVHLVCVGDVHGVAMDSSHVIYRKVKHIEYYTHTSSTTLNAVEHFLLLICVDTRR